MEGQAKESEKPLVSVVVPTMNSAEYLDACLTSIENQTYDNIETLVVDKISTDNTLDIARYHGTRILTLDAFERTEQMNLGAREADGFYVYIVGSDFVLEPNVVKEAVAKCEDEGHEAVVIHCSSDPTVSFWSKIRKFERDMYIGDELNVSARFVRKDLFLDMGGYDEEMIGGEDYDFHNRLMARDAKIGYVEASELHLGEPRTILEIVRKYYYYGTTLPDFLKRNRDRGVKQLSPLRPAFLRHWKEFFKHPVMALEFIVYQFCKYTSGIVGYVAVTIKKHLQHSPPP